MNLRPEAARTLIAAGRDLALSEDWAAWNAEHKGKLKGLWSKAPGGKRYEINHRGHQIKVVRQNVAAGGPRWKAYHSAPSGTTKVIAKGDDFDNVHAFADKYFHGLSLDAPGKLAEAAPRLAMPSQAIPGQAAPFHEPSSSSQNTAQGDSTLAESAQTAALSVTHAPIGKGGTNWVTRSKPGNQGQLPAYVQNVRNALMRDGKDESEATAIAVGTIKRWASGRGNVSPEVKAAAAKAIAEWEATKVAGRAGDKAAKAAKKAA